MLILLNGLNGMCFGWMRGLCLRLMKIVTTSLLLMGFSPRCVCYVLLSMTFVFGVGSYNCLFCLNIVFQLLKIYFLFIMCCCQKLRNL